MTTLQDKWAEFYGRSFPAGCVETDPAGVCLASTETYAAGCISTFVSRGSLDAERLRVLKKCVADLEQALPELSGDTWDYFNELHILSQGVLHEIETS